MRRSGQIRGFLAICVVACWSSIPTHAVPKLRFTEETRWTLELNPITATLSDGTKTPRLELDEHDLGTLGFEVLWPTDEHRVRIDVAAEKAQQRHGYDRTITLTFRLTFPDGTETSTRRSLGFNEGSTTLFEVHRSAGRPLTFGIQPTSKVTTAVSSRVEVGARVQFRLEIQRVEAGTVTTLETNYLNTFLGEPVAYSFNLGGRPDSESARIVMTPILIHGGIIEIVVELVGKLPDAGELRMLGGKEKWVTSRGSPSVLALESGSPPTGYRFRVTPEF